MCTMSHFANHSTPQKNHLARLHPLLFQAHALPLQALALPRCHGVPAGKAFFHIKETTTARVRGLRTAPNETCALARSLAART